MSDTELRKFLDQMLGITRRTDRSAAERLAEIEQFIYQRQSSLSQYCLNAERLLKRDEIGDVLFA